MHAAKVMPVLGACEGHLHCQAPVRAWLVSSTATPGPKLQAPLHTSSGDAHVRSVWVPSAGGGYCRVVTATMAAEGVASVPGEQHHELPQGIRPMGSAWVCCRIVLRVQQQSVPPLSPRAQRNGHTRAAMFLFVRGPSCKAIPQWPDRRLPAGISGAEAGGCGGRGTGGGRGGAPCQQGQVASWG